MRGNLEEEFAGVQRFVLKKEDNFVTLKLASAAVKVKGVRRQYADF